MKLLRIIFQGLFVTHCAFGIHIATIPFSKLTGYEKLYTEVCLQIEILEPELNPSLQKQSFNMKNSLMAFDFKEDLEKKSTFKEKFQIKGILEPYHGYHVGYGKTEECWFAYSINLISSNGQFYLLPKETEQVLALSYPDQDGTFLIAIDTNEERNVKIYQSSCKNFELVVSLKVSPTPRHYFWKPASNMLFLTHILNARKNDIYVFNGKRDAIPCSSLAIEGYNNYTLDYVSRSGKKFAGIATPQLNQAEIEEKLTLENSNASSVKKNLSSNQPLLPTIWYCNLNNGPGIKLKNLPSNEAFEHTLNDQTHLMDADLKKDKFLVALHTKEGYKQYKFNNSSWLVSHNNKTTTSLYDIYNTTSNGGAYLTKSVHITEENKNNIQESTPQTNTIAFGCLKLLADQKGGFFQIRTQSKNTFLNYTFSNLFQQLYPISLAKTYANDIKYFIYYQNRQSKEKWVPLMDYLIAKDDKLIGKLKENQIKELSKVMLSKNAKSLYGIAKLEDGSKAIFIFYL